MAAAPALLGEVAAVLNGLEGVFSTVQWGGRAYKVPGPGGRSRAKLLAFVSCDDDGKGVCVSFKLVPQRARDVVEHHDWVQPHSFRTLAPSGWLTATVRTRRQVATLGALLKESRGLYSQAGHDQATPPRRGAGAAETSDAATRIDQVMRDLGTRGWSPPQDW